MKGYVKLNGRAISWFQNGDRHRADGPAVVWKYGLKWWYLNGYFSDQNRIQHKEEENDG